MTDRPNDPPNAPGSPAPRPGDTGGITGPVSSHASEGRSRGLFSAAAEKPPESIAGYRILNQLGVGGMGVVYLAMRTEDQFKRQVAIKVIKRGMDSEEVVRRFHIERQVLSALNHPNVARVLDGGMTDDGRPYFVMEYVQGMRLDDYCDTQRLNINERLQLFAQVCQGVHHAHQNLIVHRDIKPGNILVTPEGVAKLLDFGIAKIINPHLAAVLGDPTRDGYRVMTTEYASPEQVRGDPVGVASDVYSLGVLLYELLTGRRPYHFRTRLEAEIQRVVCESEVSRPSTVVTRPDTVIMGEGQTVVRDPTELARSREGLPEKLRRKLSGDIDNIVMMALRKEPRRRYGSAEQFAEDIKRHLSGQTVIATPDSAAYRARKFAARNKFAIGAVAAVFLALCVGLTIAVYQKAEAIKQRDIAVKARQDLTEVTDFIDQGLTITFKVFDTEVSKLKGSIKARESLAKSLSEHAQKAPSVAKGSEQVKRFLAATYERLADVQGGMRSPNKGDLTSALANIEKALAIRKELSQSQPDDAGALIDLAGDHRRLTDLYVKLQDDTNAAANIAEQRRILTEATKLGAKGAQAKRILAGMEMQTAQSQIKARKFEDAERSYAAARVFYDDLTRATPDDQNVRRDMAVWYVQMGDMWIARDDAAKAFEYYKLSIPIRRALLAEDSSDRFQRDMAVTLYSTAAALQGLGRSAEASPMANEAVTLATNLLEASRAAAINAEKENEDSRIVRDLGLFKTLKDEIDATLGK